MNIITITYLWVICLIAVIMVSLPSIFWSKELFKPNLPNDLEKSASYECGFEPFDLARSVIDVQFYIIAILYLVFDVEIIFLLPWALNFNKITQVGFWVMLIFLGLLLLGLIYEIETGALGWSSEDIMHFPIYLPSIWIGSALHYMLVITEFINFSSTCFIKNCHCLCQFLFFIFSEKFLISEIGLIFTWLIIFVFMLSIHSFRNHERQNKVFFSSSNLMLSLHIFSIGSLIWYLLNYRALKNWLLTFDFYTITSLSWFRFTNNSHITVYFLAKFLLLLTLVIALYLSIVHILRFKSYATEEYPHILYLLLLSLHCMLLSTDFLVLLISVELLSFCLFILIGHTRDAVEAAIKYYTQSIYSSCFLVCGLLCLYVISSELNYDVIWRFFSEFLHTTSASSIYVLCSIAIWIVFLFKIAGFPFSMWAPDVYMGSRIFVTCIIATAVKIGIFGGFLPILLITCYLSTDFWSIMLPLSISGCLLVGAWGGLRQDNIKRFLAFSGVHHVGFILCAILCELNEAAHYSKYFWSYLFIYITTLSGIFGLITLFCTKRGTIVVTFTDLLRVNTRSHIDQYVLFKLFLLFLSMGGIPPMAGFVAKLNILDSLVHQQYLVLSIVALTTSFISVFNYLRVIKTLFFERGIYFNLKNNGYVNVHDTFSIKEINYIKIGDRWIQPIIWFIICVITIILSFQTFFIFFSHTYFNWLYIINYKW